MLLLLAGLAAGLVDLLAIAMGWHEVRVAAKPLAALLFALAAFRADRRILGSGLLCGALGDELLLWPGTTPFLLGMVAFLAMQICYIVAFTRLARIDLRTRSVARIAYAVAFVVAWWWLLPHLGTFEIPVIVYGLALFTMTNAAFALRVSIVAGALLFTLSDTTLAFSKFTTMISAPPTYVECFVMATYVAAQFFIARGMTAQATAA